MSVRLTPAQQDALHTLSQGAKLYAKHAGGLHDRRTLNALVEAGYATSQLNRGFIPPALEYTVTEAGIERATRLRRFRGPQLVQAVQAYRTAGLGGA